MSAYNNEKGRRCTKCSKYKSWSEFSINKRGINSRDPQCKECKNKQNRETRCPDHQRLEKYDIGPLEYELMLKKQNNKCAICKCTLTEKHNKSNTISVDHCHNKNIVRGLLCAMCNKGIGSFYDNPILLEGAATYLRANL